MSDEIQRLVRLETKLDIMLEQQTTMNRQFEKHDDRLKFLENTRAHLVGIAAVMGGLLSYLIHSLKGVFTLNH